MAPPRPPPPGHLQKQLLSLIRTEVERQLAPMRAALAKLTAFARSERPSRWSAAAAKKPRRAARPAPPARKPPRARRVKPTLAKRGRKPKSPAPKPAPAPSQPPAPTSSATSAFEPGDRVAFTLDGSDHTGMLLRIDRDDGTMLVDREPDGARVFVPPEAVRKA